MLGYWALEIVIVFCRVLLFIFLLINSKCISMEGVSELIGAPPTRVKLCKAIEV